jgi:hypothetical protein
MSKALWFYHGTVIEKAAAIQQEGLIATLEDRGSRGTPRGKDHYLIYATPGQRNFWGPILLRFRRDVCPVPWERDRLADPEEGPSLYLYSPQVFSIPPSQLEIRVDGKWLPLVGCAISQIADLDPMNTL